MCVCACVCVSVCVSVCECVCIDLTYCNVHELHLRAFFVSICRDFFKGPSLPPEIGFAPLEVLLYASQLIQQINGSKHRTDILLISCSKCLFV